VFGHAPIIVLPQTKTAFTIEESCGQSKNFLLSWFVSVAMAFALSSLTAGLTPDQISALKGQNHDTEIYTCAAVFSTLALFAVIVRVASRHTKHVTVGIDDVMVIVALVDITSLLVPRHADPPLLNR